MLKLTKEKALELHRQMWTDMQRELGHCPTEYQRIKYKEKWCKEHYPNYDITNNCFLCEYTSHVLGLVFDFDCKKCPIAWPHDYCKYNYYYLTAPISEILELPERKTLIERIRNFLKVEGK